MPQNRSQNNCGSTKTVKFEYLMKLLLRRMVKKSSYTDTFCVGGWVMGVKYPVITYLYFDSIDSFSGYI